MITTIQTKSLKTLLLVTCLALSLAACGDNEDKPPVSEGTELEDKAPIPEDVEKVYEEALAKMIARKMAHTGDGPAFTEEELDEFDRLEQQVKAYKAAQQKIAVQQKLRVQYQTCVENQYTKCSRLVRYSSKRNREDDRMITLGILNHLPETITYQHYFGLSGEGCESDGPVNQWTDADTVTVRYVGEGEIVSDYSRGMGSREGRCHIERQLKTPDIVFQSDKNPEELTFSYKVPPTVDDMLHVCRDRASWECENLVRGKASTFYRPSSDGKYEIPVYKVTINNKIPEGIAYQHYFSLTDECASDGPLNQWTDTNSIDVYLTRGRTVPRTSLVGGECHVGRQLKFTGTDLIISLPEKKLYFSYYTD